MKPKINTAYLAAIVLLFSLRILGQNLFWIDGVSQKIQTVDFNGTGQNTLITGVGAAYGIAADLKNNMLFWADNTAKAIKSSALDGSNEATVVSQSAGNIIIPRGIAVDDSAQKIYWTDNGLAELLSSNYNGSGITVLVSGLDCPGYVAFDSVYKKIYWADNGLSAKKIQRCNPDGSDVEDVVTGLNQVWGIAVDDSSNSIYWIDSGIEKIQRGTLGGTLPVSKTDVVTGLTNSERGLVIDEKTSLMYWSSTSGEILKAGLNGANISAVSSGLTYPQGITLTDTTISNPLPVELLSFTSAVETGKVVLHWKTATEVNNYGFDIERTSVKSGISNNVIPSGVEGWEKIGFVKGSGNSNSPKSYSFVDTDPAGGNREYRLKQINTDGSFKYSNIIRLNTQPTDYKLYQNYPNPFNPVTKIRYSIPNVGTHRDVSLRLDVYDILGRKIATLVNKKQQPGNYEITFDGSRFPSGIYLYRLQAGSYVSVKKLVIMK